MATLGEKIKYFRKRAGKSQMEVEVSTGMAAGQISRIENGEVNPTKETIFALEEALKLNLREANYLHGPTSDPATKKEIEDAKTRVKNYFARPGVLAYLTDELWRIHSVSKTFLKLGEIADKDEESFYNLIEGKNIIKLLLDEKFGIKRFFDKDKVSYEELLLGQLKAYKFEVGFRYDDPDVLETIELISKVPKYREFWDNLESISDRFTLISEQMVTFFLMGHKVRMRYSRQAMFDQPRFELIEYEPTNLVIKLLSKI